MKAGLKDLPQLTVAIAALVCSPLWAANDYLPPDGILAFPGAEGFGANTRGGRYGRVLLVTNLDDYNPAIDKPIPGSLRAAVETDGPRIVVFRVSGTIPLISPLSISKPYLTLAGQSAPGGGICLKNYGVEIHTHDVVMRYLRIRPGDEVGRLRRQQGKSFETDSLTLGGYWINGYIVGPDIHDVIIDHCSVSWANDEVLSLYGGKPSAIRNVTVQWCIISEALNNSYHHKGAHGYGSIIMGQNVTFHHNLYAHVTHRGPLVESDPLDFRNNLIYNAFGHGWGKLNYVGNYLRRVRGKFALDLSRPNPFAPDELTQIFAENNYIQDETGNQDAIWKRMSRINEGCRLSAPIPAARVVTDSPQEAYRRILESCGAVLPARDAADRRLIEAIKAGKGDIIDSQADVGGWPNLESVSAPKDSDNDGMPDEWETKYGFDPRDVDTGPANDDETYYPNDSAKDPDGDGYTNIEEYLNGTNPLQK